MPRTVHRPFVVASRRYSAGALAALTDSATVASPFTPAAVGADEFLDHWLQQQTVVTALRPGRVQIAGPRDATESGMYTLGNSGGGSYTIAWRRAPSGRWAVRSLSTS